MRENGYDGMNAEVNQAAGVSFLLAEIDTGLTFARIADGAKLAGTHRFERNLRNARKAYDSAMRFRPRVRLESEQEAIIEANLAHLRTILQALGEDV